MSEYVPTFTCEGRPPTLCQSIHAQNTSRMSAICTPCLDAQHRHTMPPAAGPSPAQSDYPGGGKAPRLAYSRPQELSGTSCNALGGPDSSIFMRTTACRDRVRDRFRLNRSGRQSRCTQNMRGKRRHPDNEPCMRASAHKPNQVHKCCWEAHRCASTKLAPACA